MRRATIILVSVIAVLAGTQRPVLALSISPDTGPDMVAGNVYALNVGGSWLYLGGKITAIRDVGNTDRCDADDLVRFNEATGKGDCTFTPALPGTQVDGITVMGNFVYVGGDFGLLRVNIS